MSRLEPLEYGMQPSILIWRIPTELRHDCSFSVVIKDIKPGV